MTSKKYRSYGVRRENNLSDLDNKEEGLNNLLNNLPGVGDGLTFISEDLNAIRGLKNSSVQPANFIGLAQSTPKITETDALGNIVLDVNGNPKEIIVRPIYRIEDRFNIYRTITEFPPVFNSGPGPYAYFMPSSILPTLTKGINLNNVNVNIDTLKVSPLVERSGDFWAIGEFIINDKIRIYYPNNFGGILWEGYYIADSDTANQQFSYETSGLFHVEYDRFNDGNWVVAKSIYAKVRQVTVSAAAVNTTSIQLALGESRYVSVGDFILGSSPANKITAIVGDLITLTTSISATINSTLSFDMNLGQDRYDGTYSINEILDKGEVPQIKKRMFWWFPSLIPSYVPDIKYLRNISGNDDNIYGFYNWNKEPANPPPGKAGSIRDLLGKAITPTQSTMGSALNVLVPTSGPRKFKTSNSTNILYTPKSSFAQINKVSTTISFKANGRYIIGTLSATDLGNVVVPQTPSSLNTIVPKNLKIKDIISVDTPTTRIVNLPFTVTQNLLPVHIIDHIGLVDYFVATSTTNTVTVTDTTNLKVDMICITATTSATAFVRITSIISPTQFTTSAPLALTAGYVFIYSNSGILDRSLEAFCTGVFGKVLTTAAVAGTNTLRFANTTGIAAGQKVQFAGAIAANVTVLTVNSATNSITLSTNPVGGGSPLTGPIIPGSTIVFAPSTTPLNVNKEICVFPLDLSPPFLGVGTGLDTGEKSIKGIRPTLNVKVDKLTINNATVATVNTATAESYDRKIALANGTFSILAKLVI